MAALHSATGTAANQTLSSSNTTTMLLSTRYVAPLPLRVAHEDYALVAGFLGGLTLIAVYVGVLTCLRCVQQQRVWQLPRPQQPVTYAPPSSPHQQYQQQRQYTRTVPRLFVAVPPANATMPAAPPPPC
jgi:hypothetical protein